MSDIIEEHVDDIEDKPKQSYYQTHPEYREYHRAIMTTKIECPVCEKYMMRSNMSSHKKTKAHKHMEEVKRRNGVAIKESGGRKSRN